MPVDNSFSAAKDFFINEALVFMMADAYAKQLTLFFGSTQKMRIHLI
jgi:hypothetical protein